MYARRRSLLTFRLNKCRPYRVTLQEGDVLYMPAFWHHEVRLHPVAHRILLSRRRRTFLDGHGQQQTANGVIVNISLYECCSVGDVGASTSVPCHLLLLHRRKSSAPRSFSRICRWQGESKVFLVCQVHSQVSIWTFESKPFIKLLVSIFPQTLHLKTLRYHAAYSPVFVWCVLQYIRRLEVASRAVGLTL